MATARERLAEADRFIALAEQKLKTANQTGTGQGARIELRVESVNHYAQADHYNLAAIAAALVDLSGPDIDLKTKALVDDIDLPGLDDYCLCPTELRAETFTHAADCPHSKKSPTDAPVRDS